MESKEELNNYLANLNGENYNEKMLRRLESLNLQRISYSRWESIEFNTKYKFSIAIYSCGEIKYSTNSLNNGFIKKIICQEFDGSEYQLLSTNSPNELSSEQNRAEQNVKKQYKSKSGFKWYSYNDIYDQINDMISPIAREQKSITAALRETNAFIEKEPKASNYLECFNGVKKVSLDMLPRPYPGDRPEKENNPICRWVRLTKESEKVMKGEPFVCKKGKVYIMVPIKYSVKDVLLALDSDNEIKEMKNKK